MTRQITNPVPARRDIDGLAVIGRTRHDLMGIRYDEGEGGNGGDAAAAEAAAAQAAASQAAQQAAASQAAADKAAADQRAAAEKVNFRGDPSEYVKELREEAKTHRLAAEKAATEAADKAKALDTTTAERDTLRRENAIIRTAPKLGANVDMLLDSASFQKTLATIDPTDTAAVEKAITDALERNSAYRSGPRLPAASGGGHQGGSNTNTPTTLAGAVSKALGG